jgi:hypothetical protein
MDTIVNLFGESSVKPLPIMSQHIVELSAATGWARVYPVCGYE